MIIRILKVSLKLTMIQNRILCPLRLLPLMTEFSLFISRHNTREQLGRAHFFEGLQNYMENKSEGNEEKTILGESKCAMDKKDRDDGN